jgi:hypothetical protein
MTPDPSIIESHVDATAALIGLKIPRECREGVVRYFGLAAGLAELVMAHPLTTEDDPAPVFMPVAPDDAS